LNHYSGSSVTSMKIDETENRRRGGEKNREGQEIRCQKTEKNEKGETGKRVRAEGGLDLFLIL